MVWKDEDSDRHSFLRFLSDTGWRWEFWYNKGTWVRVLCLWVLFRGV